jgi:hypothetical protein
MFTFQVQNPAIPLLRKGPPIYLKNKKEKKRENMVFSSLSRKQLISQNV